MGWERDYKPHPMCISMMQLKKQQPPIGLGGHPIQLHLHLFFPVVSFSSLSSIAAFPSALSSFLDTLQVLRGYERPMYADQVLCNSLQQVTIVDTLIFTPYTEGLLGAYLGAASLEVLASWIFVLT